MKTGDLPLKRPPVIPRVRRLRSWWILPVILGGAALLVLYHFNPAQYGFYPRCGLYTMTGLLCPGCGSQRALYQLIHGNLLLTCRCNLLLMLSLPWFAFKFVQNAVAHFRGQLAPQWLPHPGAIKWIVLVLIVFAILRNIPGEPFCYLAPP